MTPTIVIGAGMGGLVSAIALARAGKKVLLLEGTERIGGLAGGLALDNRTHDTGPYILLDRPGLEWAFEQIGLVLAEHVELIPLDETWRVSRPDGPTISIYRSLDRTADGMERAFPGSGSAYRAFVAHVDRLYQRLEPLQRQARPSPFTILRGGLFREAAFLLRPLGHHLAATGLPAPIRDVLGIWTHIAGQPLDEAPAPLAFVPAIVHRYGAFTVKGGIRKIPEALLRFAREIGVDVRTGHKVDRIVRDGRRVLGVESRGERIAASAVISNAPGIGTYAELLDPPDLALKANLQALPLQSPGVAAYLDVELDPTADVAFLQFWLPPGEKVRLLANPGVVDPERRGQARLLGPVDHAWAESVGEPGQRAYLDKLLHEPWWRTGVVRADPLHTRIPLEWSRHHLLWRDSMNPTMTAAFMRRGRLPHQSPVCDNLFLCGSATHPGQWVSFCAISGILAAKEALG